jgi:hypothetical protein
MHEAKNGNPPTLPTPHWQDKPPSVADVRGYAFVYPRVGRAVEAVLLGEEVAGVWLHWQQDRTVPCLGAACKVDHERSKALWHGYIAAKTPRLLVPTILGVSAEAAGQLEYLASLYYGIRGLRVRLSRKSNKKSRVVVELLQEAKVKELPPAFDVRPYLMALWGLADKPAEVPVLAPVEQSEQLERVHRLAAGLFSNGTKTERGEM